MLIALNPILVLYGNYFISESLYLPLGTLIFGLLVRIPRRPWFLLGAMALAGVAVAVRPDGLLFLPIALSGALWIYGYQYAVQKQAGRWVMNKAGIIVLSLTAFTATALPALVQRTQAFGSPFDYGAANKFLVANVSAIYSDTDPQPSLSNYLTDTPPSEIARKFLVGGFGRVIANILVSRWPGPGPMAEPIILPVLVPFFVIGALYLLTNASAWILITAMLIWIPSFSLGYDLYGQPRYLWMLIPVTSVVAIAGIDRVYESLSDDVRRIFFTGIAAGTTLFLFWPI